MTKTNRIQQKSMALMPSVESLQAVRRLIACVEATSLFPALPAHSLSNSRLLDRLAGEPVARSGARSGSGIAFR